MVVIFAREIDYSNKKNNNDKEIENQINERIENIIKTLFTSDLERYKLYRKLGGDYKVWTQEEEFFTKEYNKIYIDLYSGACTQSCLDGMAYCQLFTYIDYLANISNSVVMVTDIEIRKKNTDLDKMEINAINDYQFEYIVTMQSQNDEKTKEFSVQGEIGGYFRNGIFRIDYLDFLNYHSLSVYITGENIFKK